MFKCQARGWVCHIHQFPAIGKNVKHVKNTSFNRHLT
jgi:hypothetical protein